MLNLQGEEKEAFEEAFKMLVRTDHGRVFLAALEKDLKVLDAKNRVVGQENQTSAALYLGRLFEKANDAGYKPTLAYVIQGTVEPTNVVPTPQTRWQRILSALLGTER